MASENMENKSDDKIQGILHDMIEQVKNNYKETKEIVQQIDEKLEPIENEAKNGIDDNYNNKYEQEYNKKRIFNMKEEGILERIKNPPADASEKLLRILEDIGIKKKREAVISSFTRGNIDDPNWLNKVLKEYNFHKDIRKQIIFDYYGKPYDEVIEEGEEDVEETQKKDTITSSEEKEKEDIGEIKDLIEEKKKSLMDKIELTRLKTIEQELNEIDKNREEKTMATSLRVRIRKVPVIDTEGNLILDNNGNPIYEIIEEPIGYSQASPINTMDELKLLLLRSLSNNRNQGQNTDIAELIKALAEIFKPTQNTEVMELRNKIDNLTTIMMQKEHEREVEKLENVISHLNKKIDDLYLKREITDYQAKMDYAYKTAQLASNTLSSALNTLVEKGETLVANAVDIARQDKELQREIIKRQYLQQESKISPEKKKISSIVNEKEIKNTISTLSELLEEE